MIASPNGRARCPIMRELMPINSSGVDL